MMIVDDKIGAINLDNVEIVDNSYRQKQVKNVLNAEDLRYQESRRARKVKRIDFEER
tara:strand:- start:1853 stop:2023 length:171 start_codon:yes stop_codon:yes gene_type:complete